MSMNYDIMKTIAEFCKSEQIDPEDGAELYENIVTDLQWNYPEGEDLQWNYSEGEDLRRKSFLKVYSEMS